MSGSFSFNSFRTHKGRKTAKELRDRAAKQFIKNWVKDNVKDYLDDEELRLGNSGYTSFEMEQIAIKTFLMGRLYGRTERAEEKNKLIKKLKSKIHPYPRSGGESFNIKGELK